MTTLVQSQNISDDFPYPSNYAKMSDGNKLHYIDTGSGEVIIFLHGVPMWSYSWRKIIPQLEDSFRCVAPDFMGFGKSDKPAITYTFDDQLNYLTEFIDSQNLTKITLVMTDVGGILGTAYARTHEDKIKRLIYLEAPIQDAQSFHKDGKMMQRMMFWMGGKNKFGHRMIVNKNMFIKMLPMMMKTKLSKKNKEMYAMPFPTSSSRTPLFVLPNSFPKKGITKTQGDMADYMNVNAEFLKTTTLPKLILHAKPGMIIHKKTIQWIDNNLKNVTTLYLGKAKHLMEEDLPIEIAEAIKQQ